MRAGGFTLDVTGGEPPNEEELVFLEKLESEGQPHPHPVLRIHLRKTRLWPGAAERNARVGETAAVLREGECVLIAHESFEARIDPKGLSVELFRSPEAGGAALRIALRMALGACLPSTGGLGLHAAGLVLRCGGAAFFGVSGAGKSTLCLVSGRPVISDEFVAIVPGASPDGFHLSPTGSWSTFGERLAAGSARLRALVALEKTAAFEWEPLASARAIRRLIPSLAVPPCPGFAEVATVLLGQLVQKVPVFRMGWSPSEPPIGRVESLLCDRPSLD